MMILYRMVVVSMAAIIKFLDIKDFSKQLLNFPATIF